MVFFTHGYFLSEDPKEQMIMKPYVPLGILYLSAFLEENGVETTVFDSTFSDFQSLTQELLETTPKFLGLYVNLMTKINIVKIIDFVRNSPSLCHTKIILGGPEVRNHAENFLKRGADVVIVGEGEITMLELVNVWNENRSINEIYEKLPSVQGIIYHDLSNNLVATAERDKIKNIDELPFPNRKKINLHKYSDAWKKHHGKSTLSISSMRGCPYTCKWCSRAVYGLSYRRNSPAKVVQEIKEMQMNYQPDALWFVDDVFTISHKWLREFAVELAKEQVTLQYECITRADRMNEEIVELLKETGCFRVWIGAESGSQKVIDLMDRRVDVVKVREMIQLAQKSGIEAGTFIMLGYPGETEEDIEETLSHLKAANPSHFTLTVAYPIKGTELYQEVEAQLGVLPEWAISTDRDLDYARTYPRRYYDFAIRYVVNSVYLHKAHLNQGLWREKWKLALRAKAAKWAMWGIRNISQIAKSVTF
jgi:radical SAM superfamily enzyme YgiQ (UPF0313 family)